MIQNEIFSSDMEYIYSSLLDDERSAMFNSVFLFTGAAGFLGLYFISFLAFYKKELNIRRIICLDNFKSGKPQWITDLSKNGIVELHDFDISRDDIRDIDGADRADFIYHMASIASPTFYRKYPIDTLDANVWGLRNILDFYSDRKIKRLAFFSSSEIYGDPDASHIPTREDFRGLVDCQGPRACYDEAKRFGETMCFLYNKKFGMPITIIRPFNNYGPGMRLNDARVPADFARAVKENRDIVILSDGHPTRTFCYISDAVCGYFKALLYSGSSMETFNIGMDKPEISIKKLADIYSEAGREICDYTGKVIFGESEDKDYLNNNPDRRCPDITKARKLIGYNPSIDVEDGVRRFIRFIKTCGEENLIW